MKATSKLGIEAALTAVTEARAQRALTALIEQEARYHTFLEGLAEESARHKGQRRGARILRKLGKRHVEQREMGLQEIWAHRQLDAANRLAAIELLGDRGDAKSEHRLEELLEGTPLESLEAREPARTTEAIAKAKRLLLGHAELAKEERVQRMRDVTVARMTLAVMDGSRRRLINAQGGADRTQSSARAHATLARNLDTQATLHRELASLEARKNGTRLVADPRSWQECRRSVLGSEIWTHRQLATRCAARSLWHASCAEFMAAAALAAEKASG